LTALLSVFSISIATTLGPSSPALAAGVTTFDDGGVHDLSSSIDQVEILNDTELVVGPSGQIRETLFGVDMTGASVFDSSRLTISGGTLTGTSGDPGNATGIVAEGSAVVSMSDGMVRATTSGPGNSTGVLAAGSASVLLSGGEVHAITSRPGSAYAVVLNGDSSLEMTGGLLRVSTSGPEIRGIEANDNATVSISGGRFSIPPRDSAALVANDQSSLVVSGVGFNYPLGSISATSGTISGTLSDGTSVSLSFERASTASIHIVPEPATFILLAIGAAALVGCGWQRRKRASR